MAFENDFAYEKAKEVKSVNGSLMSVSTISWHIQL